MESSLSPFLLLSTLPPLTPLAPLVPTAIMDVNLMAILVPKVPLYPFDRQWIIIVAIFTIFDTVTIDADGAIGAIVTIGVPPLSPMDHHW
jgi:hypothetical protein